MSDDQLKPSERGPTNDEIIAEAKRISDLEWEGNEEHADFFGPLLFRLQADTSWFKPVPELLEVTQADRDLWKYLLDAPKSKCSMMDTCDPATAELQAIARHRIEALAKRDNMSMTPLVETVARIIDPSKWAVLDIYLADMLRKYKGEHIGYDPEPFKDKASMAKAQAAIAAVFDALDI